MIEESSSFDRLMRENQERRDAIAFLKAKIKSFLLESKFPPEKIREFFIQLNLVIDTFEARRQEIFAHPGGIVGYEYEPETEDGNGGFVKKSGRVTVPGSLSYLGGLFRSLKHGSKLLDNIESHLDNSLEQGRSGVNQLALILKSLRERGTPSVFGHIVDSPDVRKQIFEQSLLGKSDEPIIIEQTVDGTMKVKKPDESE